MMADPGKIMAEQTSESGEILRLRERNAQLISQLKLAQKLMLQMDQKIRAVKGNEQRLLQTVEHRGTLLWSVMDHWTFFFLPRALKQAIFDAI